MSERMPGDERRNQIIQTAAGLFAERGFRGTTTREITEAVGVSEALLFKYFPTKEALYSAIIDCKAHTEEVLERAAAAAAVSDDSGVFSAVARSLLQRMMEDSTLMRLLLFSALEGHELSTIFFETRVRRLHLYLSKYIEERIAQGAFREMDPLLAARGFVGMVIHYLLIHEVFGVRRGRGDSVERVVKALVALFLEGARRP
ncbi:MAG: TetR/AcrR family transcriptional regulator [Candidatus Methylomirabilales bacterium]